LDCSVSDVYAVTGRYHFKYGLAIHRKRFTKTSVDASKYHHQLCFGVGIADPTKRLVVGQIWLQESFCCCHRHIYFRLLALRFVTVPRLADCLRVIQAIGGSMMVPVSRLAILYTYDKEKLLNVINFITIPGLVGPIIGPTLGGWLVEIASWHWIFIINLPIGLFGMYYAGKHMPQYQRAGGKFDFFGMVFFGGSLLLLTLGIELGTHEFIDESVLLVVFASSFILMNLYYFHFKKRKEQALINLSLIRIRTLRIGVFGNLLTRLGIGGMPLLLPLLFQLGLKQSAMTSGVMLIPVALTSVLLKPWVVPVVKKMGYKNTLILNTLLIAVVIALFSLVGEHTKLPNLIPLLVVYGAVNSIQLTSMNTISLSALDNETASSGNSLLLVMQQLSMSLGISVGAFLLAKYSSSAWLHSPSILHAFKYTFLTLAAITAMTSLLFLRLEKTAGENLSGHH